jgi:phenylpropionate dioxygenase-like ring-hydroxylating dioxygenase large terminal subunit
MVGAPPLVWPAEGPTRVPYQVFWDPAIHALEQQRIYRGPTWCFLGLEAEVAEPKSWKATYVGEIPVVLTRDAQGALHAFVNRCAHRGALVCREPRGQSGHLTCVYHQWNYDLEGRLRGVPFQHGIGGKGGMPEDFRLQDHRLEPLRVTTFAGLVFGTFSPETEPIEEYLGPAMAQFVARVFNRPVRVLGYARQFIQCNWKIYLENVKDPYHASLLHLFFNTFGLNRLSQVGEVVLDARGRHHVSYSKRAQDDQNRLAEVAQANLRTYQKGFRLADPTLLEGPQEYADGITMQIQSIFPSLIVQQIANTLAVRQILPKGPEAMELVWTYVAYADDDAAMERVRLRQANLVGPAGYISMEDAEAGELVQRAVRGEREAVSFIEMGGRGVASSDHRVTETSIRGFWQEYRRLMGF